MKKKWWQYPFLALLEFYYHHMLKPFTDRRYEANSDSSGSRKRKLCCDRKLARKKRQR